MSALRRSLTELVAFRSPPGAWAAATQATVAVTLLPALFAVLGHLQLGLLASFGALIVLYASDRSRRERAARLPVLGSGFLVSAVVGILAGESLVASLAAICAVGIVFSFLALTFQTGPPGAIFPVLVTGAVGQLTAPVSAGGMGLNSFVVVGMVALGVLAGYCVVVLPLVLPAVRARDAKQHSSFRWSFAFPPDARRIFERLVMGIVLSAAISAALGLHHVAWVLLAVIGILQKDSDIHLGAIRMWQRLVGTLIGAGLAMLFLLWTPEGLALVGVVGVLIFGFVSLLRRNLMFALMFVTPMALLLVAGGRPDTFSTFTGVRIVDTLVGGAVAASILAAVGIARRMRSSTPADEVPGDRLHR